MINCKIYLGLGALVLTIASVFAAAGRAGTKWIGGELFVTIGATHICTSLSPFIPNHFSSTPGVNQATIRSVGGSFRSVWTNSTCLNKAYFRP